MEPVTAEFAIPGESTRRRSQATSGFGTTDALLVLMAVIWGVNFSVAKLGAAAFPPLAFNATRVTLATIILLSICFLGGYQWPSRSDLRKLLLLGVIGNCVYQVFFIEAISRTRAGNVAIVMASTPAWLALIGRMRGTDHVGRRAMLGIAASLAGIALVILSGSGSGQGGASLGGDALALAACISWATYTVLLKPLTHRTDALVISTVTLAGGAVPLSLIAIPDLRRTHWSAVPLAGWGAVLYCSILAMVVAYLFWYRGLRVFGPTRTAMYANLQPIIALIVAGVMIGETPTIWQGVGAASIMTGLFLTRS